VHPFVLGHEPTNLGPQLVVAAAGGAQPSLPPGGVGSDRSVEQLADLSPALRRHLSLPRSWPASRTRVRRHSCSTVVTKTLALQ
jgi:hypothetical protein